MTLRRVVASACLAWLISAAMAQEPAPKPSPPQWTVLVDPVCPVATFYGNPAPNAARHMRVMYFPGAKDAKIKDPQSLTLNIGFNYPNSRSSSVVLFSRKDNYWEAFVSLEPVHAVYAIFSIRDDKANIVDDNSGQLWDVVFCSPTGQKDVNSVLRQAQSHTGVSWGLNLRRPTDYKKAVSVIEAAMAVDSRMRFALRDLWTYKAERDGGDAQAWARVAKEVEQFLADHRDEREARYVVGDLIVRHREKLPADFIERTISDLDARQNDPKHSLRARVEYNRAISEPDPKKRLAALDAFIAKYPESSEAAFAQQSRFDCLVQLGDVAGAEAAFVKYRERAADQRWMDPNLHYEYLSLARLYLDKGVKLEQALKLIAEAGDSLKSNSAFVDRKVPEQVQRSLDAECALLRARVYLALHKPELAVPEARKALEIQKNAETHFRLAQALAAAGDKRKALDEYFEAALLPSNQDLEYGAELRQFYLRQHFGDPRHFDGELQRRKATRFQAANYAPQLVDQDAPTFQFTTIKGEKFEAAALSRHTVIVNFWSPG